MKKNTLGFTLVELMLITLIIIILLLGISTIRLNAISDNQRVGIFFNKINSNISTAINNSLIGKGINSNIDTPNFWKVNINSNSNGSGYGTGNIIISYGSGTFQTATGLSIKSDKFYQIINIKCSNLDNTNTGSVTNIDLYIKNGDITLSGCTNANAKILNFDVLYKNFKKHIKINSVNNILN